MKVIKIIVDELPEHPNYCPFWKNGLFLGKCKLLKKSDWEVCYTDKCPLEKEKSKQQISSDRFDHILRHWEKVPYDREKLISMCKNAGLSDEQIEQIVKIAEEE